MKLAVSRILELLADCQSGCAEAVLLSFFLQLLVVKISCAEVLL
jgi:hypothetical protein